MNQQVGLEKETGSGTAPTGKSPSRDRTPTQARPRGESVLERARPGSSAEARRELQKTRGRISETLDALEDRVEERKRVVQSAARKAASRLEEQIERRPVFSAGVAFGAGMAFGFLTGGRPDEEDSEQSSKSSRRGGGLSRSLRSVALTAATRLAMRYLRKRFG